MIEYLSLQKINALHEQEIVEAVEKVVRSGWYLHGQATERFERHYADFIGTRHCIGCGNGLDALTLIFRAYKELGVLHDGDEILVPANTFVASILSITENGLQPILVEPDYETLEIDERLIESHITDRTRALLLVHLYGRCAYTDEVAEQCRRHGLLLIEDNAQAHGCRYGNKRTGSLGNAAAHSFYPGKNLGAMGDAGAVTTNDDQLAQMVRAMGNYGSSRKYVFDYVGRNSRLDEIQAALLDAKLKYLDEDNKRRQQIADRFYREIDNPRITLPGKRRWLNGEEDNVFHIFPILCADRDVLQSYLKEKGVPHPTTSPTLLCGVGRSFTPRDGAHPSRGTVPALQPDDERRRDGSDHRPTEWVWPLVVDKVDSEQNRQNDAQAAMERLWKQSVF